MLKCCTLFFQFNLNVTKVLKINSLALVILISSYLYPFKLGGERFRHGTKLDTVWRHYTFDRRFRLIVLDALERVEITVRSQMAYHFSMKYGAFDFFEKDRLPHLTESQFQFWKGDIEKEIRNSRDYSVLHFNEKYGDSHPYPPIWITNDRMFGVLTILLNLLRYAAPTSDWLGRFMAFLEEYPDIPLAWMGFPEDWRASPLWRAPPPRS